MSNACFSSGDLRGALEALAAVAGLEDDRNLAVGVLTDRVAVRLHGGVRHQQILVAQRRARVADIVRVAQRVQARLRRRHRQRRAPARGEVCEQ